MIFYEKSACALNSYSTSEYVHVWLIKFLSINNIVDVCQCLLGHKQAAMQFMLTWRARSWKSLCALWKLLLFNCPRRTMQREIGMGKSGWNKTTSCSSISSGICRYCSLINFILMSLILFELQLHNLSQCNNVFGDRCTVRIVFTEGKTDLKWLTNCCVSLTVKEFSNNRQQGWNVKICLFLQTGMSCHSQRQHCTSGIAIARICTVSVYACIAVSILALVFYLSSLPM